MKQAILKPCNKDQTESASRNEDLDNWKLDVELVWIGLGFLP